MGLGQIGFGVLASSPAMRCRESDALRQEFANLLRGFSLSSSSAGY
jgi:hypothetical protein